MNLLALLLSCLGFACLALAMDRYHRQVAKRAPCTSERSWLRRLGVAGLIAGFITCVIEAGWSSGTVLWLALASIAALLIVLVMSYRPHFLAALLFWRETAEAKRSNQGPR